MDHSCPRFRDYVETGDALQRSTHERVSWPAARPEEIAVLAVVLEDLALVSVLESPEAFQTLSFELLVREVLSLLQHAWPSALRGALFMSSRCRALYALCVERSDSCRGPLARRVSYAPRPNP